jgi:hypothetical protein
MRAQLLEPNKIAGIEMAAILIGLASLKLVRHPGASPMT